MAVIPIIAAISYAASLVHYKWLVSRTGLELKPFLALHFVTLFVVTLFFAPFFGGFEPTIVTEPRYFVLLLLLAGFGFAHNYFLARGLRRESLHEYEIIDLLVPVFTIILAAVAFIDEREPIRLSLALLAAGAFLITHVRRHHLHFKQADRWLIYTVFVMAIERILVKPLLLLAEPVSLYTLRTGIIAVLMLLAFRPKITKLPIAEWGWLALNALVGSVSMMLIWTSIDLSGIVVTELYMLITPMILALVSVAYMKEQWSFRQGLAFIAIIGSIIAMQLLG